MYVVRERAGQGVGAALLAHLIGEARREPGLTQLILTVTEPRSPRAGSTRNSAFVRSASSPGQFASATAYFDKNHMILFRRNHDHHRFGFPTTIHFGAGARKLVAEHLKAEGVARPLIVTDRGLAPLPMLAEFARRCRASTSPSTGVCGNPVTKQVKRAWPRTRRTTPTA